MCIYFPLSTLGNAVSELSRSKSIAACGSFPFLKYSIDRCLTKNTIIAISL